MIHLADGDLDSFCTWLCQREHEIVGWPGMVYHCPLAQWLSECSGHIYGVESKVYGRATCAYHCWRLLPRWAEVFVAWSPRDGLSSGYWWRSARHTGER
jgi:hypothetical protein